MATQTTKIIDVTRGFSPVDPKEFPETYHISSGEDNPEKGKEVLAYEGYNFLPTSYGYKSYFGVTSVLNINALTSRVDEVFIIQNSSFENIAVALCEDGIWTKVANATGAWTHEIILAVPAVGVHYDWSHCIISNDLYCYRQGDTAYHKFSSEPQLPTPGEIQGALPTVLDPFVPHPANAFYSVTPTFLNMAGQLGIFRAGSRLGFWDSADSISWTSIDDFADATPSITTLAGSAIFLEIQGRIINILSYKDSFIVYSTKAITLIARDEASTFQWNPVVVYKDGGIAFRRQCCQGDGIGTQYAFTSNGLVQIEEGKASSIATSLTDSLKKVSLPIFLSLVEGRYLFLEIMDSAYISGLVTFTTSTIPTTVFPYPPENLIFSPKEQNTVNSIYDGTNEDVMAQLAAYALANGLPAPSGGTYTLNKSITVHDSGVFKPLTEGLPIFNLTYITNNTKEVLEGGMPTGVNSLTAGGSIVGAPFDWNYSTPIQVASWKISPAGLPAEVYDHATFKQYLASTPVIDPVVPIPVPDTTTWGVAETIVFQQNLWTQRDKELNDMLSYIGLTSVAPAYLTENFSPAAMASPPYDSYKIAAQVFFSSATEKSKSIWGIRETLQLNNKLFDVDSGWTVPVVEVTGNVTKLKRTRNRVTTMWDRITLEPTIPVGGEVLGITYKYIRASSDIFALSADTSLIANPSQEAVINISSISYTGVDGNVHSVPPISITFPSVNPFYYQVSGEITLPPSNFLLQDGSIGPVYPTMSGALVYDMELKKWGKMKQEYKCLVDWSPLNNLSGNIIPFEVFGVHGGIVQTNGNIALFDKYPVDSYIKYGKIGYHREGFTKAEEIRVSFASPSAGIIRAESSLDGYSAELGLSTEDSFMASMGVVAYPSIVGRWHTISVIGTYDIKHLEFRGTKVGNR